MVISKNRILYLVLICVGGIHGMVCYYLFIHEATLSPGMKVKPVLAIRTVHIIPKSPPVQMYPDSNAKSKSLADGKSQKPTHEHKDQQRQREVIVSQVTEKQQKLKKAKAKMTAISAHKLTDGEKHDRVANIDELPKMLSMETEKSSPFIVKDSVMKYYYDELIKRMQLELSLPEPGEVQLKLTVCSMGSIAKIEILESDSEKNRYYIESRLARLRLPPFGEEFSGKSEHIFNLRLSSFS